METVTNKDTFISAGLLISAAFLPLIRFLLQFPQTFSLVNS